MPAVPGMCCAPSANSLTQRLCKGLQASLLTLGAALRKATDFTPAHMAPF